MNKQALGTEAKETDILNQIRKLNSRLCQSRDLLSDLVGRLIGTGGVNNDAEVAKSGYSGSIGLIRNSVEKSHMITSEIEGYIGYLREVADILEVDDNPKETTDRCQKPMTTRM